MSCDGPVSYLAEATAASKDDGWRGKAMRVLQPLLDRAVERPHGSNMVVRRALRLLPARYRDQALAWIRREPTRSETHFLFVAWLRSGLPLEEISADVEFWFFNGGEADPQGNESRLTRFWIEDCLEVAVIPTGAFSPCFDRALVCGQYAEVKGEMPYG